MSQAPGYVRTGTPISAGVILAIAAHRLGLSLTVEETAILTGAFGAAWYCVGRALETWHPKLGYVLGVAKQPAYSDRPAPSPGEGEAVEAVVVDEPAP